MTIIYSSNKHLIKHCSLPLYSTATSLKANMIGPQVAVLDMHHCGSTEKSCYKQ